MKMPEGPQTLPKTRSSRDQHVAIVGGGTAGWMAAATLRRRLRCNVTLIESTNAPGVGVGEATIPAMIDWLENMGIDEDEFLRRTGGTYKLAIRFDNWVTPKHRYWHPFGICGANINGVDLIHFWKRGIDAGMLEPDAEYTDYSLQRLLCDHGRAPRSLASHSLASHTRLENYAYHLDAGRLADFIREIAIKEGVTHRIGEVTGAVLGEHGEIQQVNVANQPPIVADLYLDCSGFASVLIEKTLQVDWIDWSDTLLCDRAVVVRAPGMQENAGPYTTSTGLDAGWAWRIPLRDNMGAGYVYSSRHTTADQARNELLRHVGLDDDASTRELSMRVGYRKESWSSNCVSLGLASGFVEPLESTGIFLVQRALDELVDCLPRTPGTEPRRETFNMRMRTAYEEVRDFVLLHYIVSRRDDTSFWRDARNVELPESLAEAMHRYTEYGEVRLPPRDPVFAEANHHFIMAGAGRYPATHANLRNTSIDSREVVRLLDHLRQRNSLAAEQLARHRELLQHIHNPQPASCFA